MAVSGRKRRKRKSKRVRLAEAFRDSCDPLLFSFGFRNPAKMDWERWTVTRRNIFLRWRGEYFDEVIIRWRTLNRPTFFIEFRTTQVERMRPPGAPVPVPRLFDGRMSSWMLRIGRRRWSGEQFGILMGVERTIDLATRRLRELNDYLLMGAHAELVRVGLNWRGYHFVDDDLTLDYPVFWEELDLNVATAPPGPSRRSKPHNIE